MQYSSKTESLHKVFFSCTDVVVDYEPRGDNSDIDGMGAENCDATPSADTATSAELEFDSCMILPIYFYSCSRSSITEELVNYTGTRDQGIAKDDKFIVS